jgi:hypothetical protein
LCDVGAWKSLSKKRVRHLGMETQRQWSDLASARTTPVLLGLFSMVALMADRLIKSQGIAVRTAAEVLWLLLWSMIGGAAGFVAGPLWGFVLLGVDTALGLGLTVYLAFGQGWWIPIVPPALAWLIAAPLFHLYHARSEKSASPPSGTFPGWRPTGTFYPEALDGSRGQTSGRSSLVRNDHYGFGSDPCGGVVRLTENLC